MASPELDRIRQFLVQKQQAAFFVSGLGVVALLLVFSGVTAAVAAVAAWIALMRHFAQSEADRQRRINDAYSKAVEQLGSEKVGVRLGGIYTLERISWESSAHYWTVMETLTAFVREEAKWTPDDAKAPAGRAPPTDIAAILSVICRRPEAERNREKREGWQLDLRDADLRGADLREAHLEGARMAGAHLGGADLWDAHLEDADLSGAILDEAFLVETRLDRANLTGAHLRGARLFRTHFEGANLYDVRFGNADLSSAFGDGHTRMNFSDGVPRPRHWPSPAEPADIPT